MYLEYFQLKTPPFSPTPDTRFYVESGLTQPLFLDLIEAVNQPDGFARIIGDAGSGKTLHCRKLLNALRCHKKRYNLIHIPQPRLSEEGLLLAIAQELRLQISATRSGLRTDVVNALNHELDKPRANVMVIDEGQTMPDDTLEQLLELTEKGRHEQKLIRVVLFTMPLNEKTRDFPANRQLQDRITLERELVSFDREGVDRYLQTRLREAGHRGAPLYSDEAIDVLFRASQGVPRLINLLAHKSLTNAFNANLDQVQALQVKLAAAATEIITPPAEPENRIGWFSRLRRRTG